MTAELTDTIVAANSSQDLLVPDSNPITGTNKVHGSNNLLGTGGDQISGANNMKNILAPELAALGDYGGPTPTLALMTDSPAIGAGKAIPAE